MATISDETKKVIANAQTSGAAAEGIAKGLAGYVLGESAATAIPVVKIYVRRGDRDDERHVSVRIPSGVNVFDLLDRGYAIDGNEAVYSVTAYDDVTMVDHLLDVERKLVDYLRERGFIPQFA